jgi:peptidoglycan biosynthesis protein MviN/MurJ (putative lipid II flippase)
VLRTIIWISAPVAVICYFARGYLARLIFTRNAPEIALIFGFLIGAIFFRTIYTLVSRWFYSQKDTWTPMFVSLFTISLNIVLAYILSKPSNYGVAGLALAQSIVAMAEVLVLMIVMVIRDPKLLDIYFWGGCARILSVTGFSVIAGFVMISLYPLGIHDTGFVTLGTKVGFIAAVVFATHVAMSGLFGLDEAKPIFARLQKLVFRPINLQ